MATTRNGIHLATVFAAAALLATSPAPAEEEPPRIRLNTIGYLPGRPKQATIAAACERFAVLRVKDGSKALEGRVTGPAENRDTGERLSIADFSALDEPGEYRLEVPGVGRSAPFRVAADVYREPFVVVARGMYLWRCGTAVRGEHGGRVFAHGACHTDDARLDVVAGRHERADGVGGWHDAGDYNKYVVNAGVTVGAMLRAWEDFGPRLREIRLDIPESGNATPDFLDELRWELDWLLKMQAPDGSAYHKLSTKRFGGFVLPERETTERYFTPWSSAATADLVAMTAQAARDFRPYDSAFADRCLAAARKGWAFLASHPGTTRPT